MGIDISLWAAFGAGVLSFFSPCILPLIPVYSSQLAAVSVTNKSGEHHFSRWGTTLQTLIFISGFTLVFVSLGATSSLLGKFLILHKVWLLKLGGVFVILMGLNLIGVLRLSFLKRHWVPLQNTPPNAHIFRSFFLGTAFALGWTPCVGPVLASVLTVAATGDSIWQGALLLTFYSLGMAIPFLALCLSFDRFPGLQRTLRKYSRGFLIVSGIFLTLLGALMFFNKLSLLTAYLTW